MRSHRVKSLFWSWEPWLAARCQQNEWRPRVSTQPLGADSLAKHESGLPATNLELVGGHVMRSLLLIWNGHRHFSAFLKFQFPIDELEQSSLADIACAYEANLLKQFFKRV